MEVRRANHEDVKDILDYLEEYHKTSNMSDIKFIRRYAARFVDQAISVHGIAVFISRLDDDTMVGILVGELVPYFFNPERVYATDSFFVSSGGGDILIRQFRKWAFSQGADRIISAVTSGEPRADSLFRLMKFEQTGGTYVFRRKVCK